MWSETISFEEGPSSWADQHEVVNFGEQKWGISMSANNGIVIARHQRATNGLGAIIAERRARDRTESSRYGRS